VRGPDAAAHRGRCGRRTFWLPTKTRLRFAGWFEEPTQPGQVGTSVASQAPRKLKEDTRRRASRHQIARTLDDRIRPSRVNTGMRYKCAVAAMIRSGRSGTSSRGMAAMLVAMS